MYKTFIQKEKIRTLQEFRKCSFTGENLYYTGEQQWVLDGASYYENESGSIKFSVCPRFNLFSHNGVHYQFDGKQWIEYIDYCNTWIPKGTSTKDKRKIKIASTKQELRWYIRELLIRIGLKKDLWKKH